MLRHWLSLMARPAWMFPGSPGTFAITMTMGVLIGWVVRGMMMKPAAEGTIAEVAFNAKQEEMMKPDKP